MKRLSVFALVIIIGMALCITGCGAPDQDSGNDDGNADSPGTSSTENDKVIVGYWGGTCEAPIYVAYENGYFEDEGLNVELLKITTDVAPLMANNELHVFQLTPDKFKPMEQGLDLKIVDGLHTGCIQGAASVESGIQTVADLEGKTVAAQVGSIAQIQIASQMVKLGLDPNKVNWVTYPLPQMELALNKGEIDAFACYDPYPEIAVQNGAVKFYSNTFDEGLAEWYCCFLGINGTFLAENPETCKKVVRAFRKAAQYLEEHPEEAAQMAIDKGYIAGTPELNAKLISDYRWITGDKELAYNSILEIWNQIDRAGALEKGKDKKALADSMFVWLGGTE